MQPRQVAAVALIIALLPACSLMRTHYTHPQINVPATYAHSSDDAKASVNRWWESFGDLRLDALVAEALRSNNDLALAALNVRAAELQVRLAVVNPAVAAGYTYDYSRALNGSTAAVRFHSLTGSVSYEVDLWDQLAATKDAALSEARATV